MRRQCTYLVQMTIHILKYFQTTKGNLNHLLLEIQLKKQLPQKAQVYDAYKYVPSEFVHYYFQNTTNEEESTKIKEEPSDSTMEETEDPSEPLSTDSGNQPILFYSDQKAELEGSRPVHKICNKHFSVLI